MLEGFMIINCLGIIEIDTSNSKLYNQVTLAMDFLIDGQISSFYPDQPEGKLLTLIMLHKLTQSL